MDIEFEKKFIDKYSQKEFEEIEIILDDLLQSSKTKISNSKLWTASQSVKKINALQFTHFISLNKESKGKDDEEIELEYENGINNGTVLRNYCMDGCGGFEYSPNIVKVLKNIEIDWERINPKANKILVESVFNYHKEDILKLYSKQNYDDYVTGGGTNVTDKFYEEKRQRFHNIGLFWTLVYEEVEADRNFV